ncbi:hypothetical protein ABEB36_006874 [Hypothenemus hampei]|uniref:Uncharacterized protein n=1 Tax=Hypothenemus hampei TaxID=57062 RepID=A0ABD1ESI8_HYPHA
MKLNEGYKVTIVLDIQSKQKTSYNQKYKEYIIPNCFYLLICFLVFNAPDTYMLYFINVYILKDISYYPFAESPGDLLLTQMYTNKCWVIFLDSIASFKGNKENALENNINGRGKIGSAYQHTSQPVSTLKSENYFYGWNEAVDKLYR